MLSTHVVKQAGGVEVADDFLALSVAEGVAHFDGQVGEHGGRFGVLQAFDADVADGEIGCGGQGQAQHHQSEGKFFHFHNLSKQTGNVVKKGQNHQHQHQ